MSPACAGTENQPAWLLLLLTRASLGKAHVPQRFCRLRIKPARDLQEFRRSLMTPARTRELRASLLG